MKLIDPCSSHLSPHRAHHYNDPYTCVSTSSSLDMANHNQTRSLDRHAPHQFSPYAPFSQNNISPSSVLWSRSHPARRPSMIPFYPFLPIDSYPILPLSFQSLTRSHPQNSPRWPSVTPLVVVNGPVTSAWIIVTYYFRAGAVSSFIRSKKMYIGHNVTF